MGNHAHWGPNVATVVAMPRVLLVAPTIDRNDVGEAWVAYQWAINLAANHDLTVLTYRKRGRPPIADQLPGVRVIEWLEPPIVGRAERLNSLLKPAYFPFAWSAHRWIHHALSHGEHFDIAHQPLPVAMRYPSPLAGKPFPYVIGPVGGGIQSPPSFDAEDTAPWYLKLRRFDSFRIRRDPWLRRSYEQAACVLGIAPYVRELLRDLNVRRLEYMSETALTELPTALNRHHVDGPVRLLFVGRVIRTKGARDLVAAVARLVDVDVEVDIVGDGFDLRACQELAHSLGVDDKIIFHGSVPRSDVDKFYRRADVFVFPSYREPGGNVVFEAMGYGLPLIVCELGGPGAAVDDESAIRLPASNTEQYAADLADAITQLASNPERRARMGAAARRRVGEVGLWSRKVAKMGELYDQLIGA
jgi:glycosyltransferase involved in cell wall biosynthesis